jgi:hypothetical protein
VHSPDVIESGTHSRPTLVDGSVWCYLFGGSRGEVVAPRPPLISKRRCGVRGDKCIAVEIRHVNEFCFVATPWIVNCIIYLLPYMESHSAVPLLTLPPLSISAEDEPPPLTRHLGLSVVNDTSVRFKNENIGASPGVHPFTFSPRPRPNLSSMSWEHFLDPSSSQADYLSALLGGGTDAGTSGADGKAHCIIFAAVVDLLLIPAFGAFRSPQLPTNPTGGPSEIASYDTFSAMRHFNLMPGNEVAGLAPELDTSASASYHAQIVDPPYPSTRVHDNPFDECFGIVQLRI